MKVLSIDDSRAVHAFITDCLKIPGIDLQHAYNGNEGIQRISGAEKFDIVLLDWEMPGLSGVDVVKKVRELGIQVPIIMITSKNAVDEIEGMLALGVNEYVMKPFTGEILLDKIESVLGVELQKP